MEEDLMTLVLADILFSFLLYLEFTIVKINKIS